MSTKKKVYRAFFWGNMWGWEHTFAKLGPGISWWGLPAMPASGTWILTEATSWKLWRSTSTTSASRCSFLAPGDGVHQG